MKKALLVAAALAVGGLTPTHASDSNTGSPLAVQVAQTLTKEQQAKLEALYAEAGAAAAGKSEAERQDIFRAYMPKVTELVAPGTQQTNYASARASNDLLAQAERQLAVALGYDGAIDFYP